MKIYTKTGDKGSTSLVGGDRTKKHDLRVWAYGSIDEANSSIGMAKIHIKEKDILDKLLKIQKTLFEVGAELASIGTDYFKTRVSDEDIRFLEETIDNMNELKPSQTGFIVPGGTVESAHLDVARTDVRRAERYIAELTNHYDVNENLMKYVNRLSDAIYTIARYFDYKDIMKKTEENIKKFSQNNQISNNLEVQKGNKVTISKTAINREAAEYVTKKCIQKSYEVGVPMVICVTDFNGSIVLLTRMDNSLLASIEIATKKAYTAAVLKASTHELRKLSLPTGELYGINNDEKIIVFGGGFPLRINGEIVGAIGVSGGTVEQDMLIAKHGLSAFEEVVESGIRK
ncbi:cob(I)yrinic acid a,c-diamide adenosyltransferase [Clostridium peptidivorans]|uniref:cob(I)yrinic acid a,c-diamide adenosyltransferase n=1 Tax=Clostridium peptidivorans TaxID=100174 RepID=UPI000BE3E495|nr:cob(I)yrinic acid a,c-diamide adenosyltransferase [Clostridium peptidivorans]